MKVCSIEGCDREVVLRGWCFPHYKQWWRRASKETLNACICDHCGAAFTKSGQGPIPRHCETCRPTFAVCSIDGCEKKVEARGWCWSHWRRWKRYGSPVNTITCQRCEQSFEAKKIDAMYCAECARIRACERTREWVAENPDWARSNQRLAQSRRRCRVTGAGGSHTEAEWIDLCEAHGWFCDYCGTELTSKTVTRDHVLPVSRGGSDDIANIVPCCKSCNSSKGTRTPDEFLAVLA